VARELDTQYYHSQSLLERANKAGCKGHFLCIQYRMNPAICYVVSNAFYDGELHSEENLHYQFQDKISLSSMCWVDVRGKHTEHSPGCSNRDEVDVCTNIAISLRNTYPTAKIFILAMYAQQRNLIIEKTKSIFGDDPGISVLTADSSQGDEADFVIISLTRMFPNEFVSEKRRLCVSMSRSKYGCIFVGNKRAYTSETFWSNLIPLCKAV
jgi:superfamily I DNA and/or RNA helicase